eukprot:scaffold952_cov409-Prasinococcus_capsulatus_cf.AAC.39
MSRVSPPKFKISSISALLHAGPPTQPAPQPLVWAPRYGWRAWATSCDPVPTPGGGRASRRRASLIQYMYIAGQNDTSSFPKPIKAVHVPWPQAGQAPPGRPLHFLRRLTGSQHGPWYAPWTS